MTIDRNIQVTEHDETKRKAILTAHSYSHTQKSQQTFSKQASETLVASPATNERWYHLG